MMISTWGKAAALAAMLAASAPAAAQTTASADKAPPAPLSIPDAFADAAIDDKALGQVAGREDVGTMVSSATQRNTVANNSVVGTSVTGNVQIDGNAFQNLQGFAVISANSGNNVAINSAMNVTIRIGTP